MKTKKEERKYHILGHIIQDYVSTAVPVSSRAVSNRMGGCVSSATVRNVMVELEEEGFIIQPHTSAGRVPTNLGYRCYVNNVKNRMKLEQKKARMLAAEYDMSMRTIEEVIERTSYLISRELNNAGIVMWPGTEDLYLKRLELVKANAETVLAVLVTKTNAVKNYIVTLERQLDVSDLDVIANYVNDRYESSSLYEVSYGLRTVLNGHLDDTSSNAHDLAISALDIIDTMIKKSDARDISWGDLSSFMHEPEFQDINITRRILRMFSEKSDIIQLMSRELPHRELRVYIGEENNYEGLRDFSIVTSGYTLRGKTVGRIGVVGPTRMDYDYTLGVVACLSEIISRKLEEINS